MDIIIESTALKSGEQRRMSLIRALTQDGAEALGETEAFLNSWIAPQHYEEGMGLRICEDCVGIFMETLSAFGLGLNKMRLTVTDHRVKKFKPIRRSGWDYSKEKIDR